MSVLETTGADLENGVTVIPALGADNVVRILVINHKYRMERTTDLTITLPPSVPDSSPVTYYLIDAGHSDFYDQGVGPGTLETVAAPPIVAGTITLTMEPRSVHLLEFAEAPPPPTIGPYPGATTWPSSITYPGGGVLPENVVRPAISGYASPDAPIVGETLESTPGTWTNTPTSYVYEWQDSPDAQTWTTRQTGASSTYALTDANIGNYVRVGVVATNDAGDSAQSLSAFLPQVEQIPVPANTSPPVVTGTTAPGNVLVTTDGEWTGDPTGFTYQWQSSPDGIVWEDVVGETDPEYILVDSDVGLFFRVGVTAGNAGGSSIVAYSEAVGPVTLVPSPSEDPMAPCTQWITGDDVADCCNVETSSSVLFDLVAQQASDLLFSISGRLFAGECSRTVRPACSSCWCGYQVLSRGHIIGPWDFGYPLDLCDCCLLACDPSLVKLAGVPIREVTEVKINGNVLDPSEYRVFNERYLQRLNSVRWPVSQNLGLPDTEDHTFSVTYSYGADPPALAVSAAAQIACEMYKACNSDAGACALPTGVTRITRQGITIDKLAFTSWGFRDGRWATGLSLVDAFLASVNPAGLQRRPVFWAPGHRRYAQDWG